MNSQMNLQVARERIADLHRQAAAAQRVTKVPDQPKRSPVIALRMAGPDEAAELAELAALDSKRPLKGDALVAVVDGKLIAAISLVDRQVIADPLVRTAEATVLLRARAAQLLHKPRARRYRFRPRFA